MSAADRGRDAGRDAGRIERYTDRVFAERARLAAALADGAGHQRRVLADLLAFNAGTEFGRGHNFHRVRTLADFRKAVPVGDYAALAPCIERMAAGEPNVLTADEPVVYFTSSGSTGAHKKIPVTPRFMRSTFFPFFYAAWAPLVEHFPAVLGDPDAVLNLKHDPLPAPATTASGRPHLGASQVDFGTAFGEPLSAEPGTAASWATLPVPVAAADHLEKAYLRLRCAAAADVRCVIGINPAAVAALPYQLRLWWPRIVQEIRDGTLGGRPYGWPDPDRAARLERLAGHFGTVRPAHVWPNLAAVFCWPTGLAGLYLPRLREEFGAGVSVLAAPVAASEGPVAVTLDRHGTAGSLVVTAAVYEFVDADETLGPDAVTLEPHELTPGRDYHVVFSHVGGLYRYAGGDVVRVLDVTAGVPRLEYAGRGTPSDAAGERLREAEVIRALAAALGAGGLEVHNAACRVSPAGPARREPGGGQPRYEFALAPRTRWTAAEADRLAVRLDAELGRQSAGYGAVRAADRLGPAELRQLDPDAFLREWHGEVGRGVRPAQVKDRLFRTADSWHRLTGPPAGPDRPAAAGQEERGNA